VRLALALIFSGILATSPTLGEKPSWAGDKGADKHKEMHKEQKGERATTKEIPAKTVGMA